ncbi:hypothetical protein VNO78_34360 [Psophocarpus tetragonolobus]|uniref:Uncharacterized protein n=1 Tax=Psophocarpus tetragonolobus TaxID=3891 RepID=A0AAN9RNT7_PSOTE
MGLEIVRQESTKYPEGRSRLKDREDVNKVLSKMRETDKVEAIEIDSSQIATLSSQADILKNMSNLRLLKINYPLLTELSMPPSHVQRLLQDAIDSKRGDLKRSHMLEELPQFSMAKNLECANLTSCHSSHDLVNLECESLCEAHAPMFSLHNQVASLLSECKEVVSLASEIHIKCLYYLYIDGYSCPEEFSFTSKEERQLNITHSGMEILNSSIGYLSNLEGSDVDKNVPNELLCLRASYYVKLSKRMKRDNGIEKPKLRILFDGLRFSQRISFHELYYSAAIPQNISAFSRCHVLRMEASEVRRLQEVFPDEIKDDNNRIVHIIQILDMGRTLQAWYITTRGGMDFDKYSYSYTILKVAPKLAFCKRIL